MEIVNLIIAVLALVIAILAYIRTGGIEDLRGQVNALGATTDTLRTRTTDTLEVLRTKTADTLDRLEKAVRGTKEAPSSVEARPPSAESPRPFASKEGDKPGS